MEEDVTGSGGRLGKRPSESGREVDYKMKAGTAWSHSYLNQKPWHPLSYPNQRRKWIAEQTHANHSRRAEEVAREFAQEQDFFRQTALFSKKEKEKVEMMKAVSFMYVRPPGYDAESAKAAEIADEQKRSGQTNIERNIKEGTGSQIPDSKSGKNQAGDKKPRPKDVFGRTLPTEEEFEVLKNAPRLETGVPGRIKPFGVEVRNVRCVRCGTFGHQSGDRECPLKDVIMPNEESRLKRDDPLTAIMAQTDSSEPLKWELKQKPGMSPPRGGFKPDDPNQQIVAEDIIDEYGGFLGGGDIPLPLSNFTTSKSKKHSKQKNKRKQNHGHKDGGHFMSSDSDVHKDSRKGAKTKSRQAGRHHSISPSSDSENDKDSKRQPKSKYKKRRVPPNHDSDKAMKKYSSHSDSDSDEESKQQPKSKYKKRHSLPSDYESDRASKHQPRRKYKKEYSSSSDSERDEESKRQPTSKYKKKHSSLSDSENGKESMQQSKSRYKKKHRRRASSPFGPEADRERRRDSKRNPKEQHQHQPWSSDAEAEREGRRKSAGKHKKRSHLDSNVRDDYDSDRYHRHRNLDPNNVNDNDNSDRDHNHHHHRKHRH